MNRDASPAPQPFLVVRSPLALGPIVVVVVFVIRSFMPIFDPLVLSITAGLVAVVGLMFGGQRWAGIAFLAFPIALFASPAGREFAFNLSSIDDVRWRWHAIAGLLALGFSTVVAVRIALGPPSHWSALPVAITGLALGLAMIVAVRVRYQQPAVPLVSAARRQALPVIDTLNFGYDLSNLGPTGAKGYRAIVRNPSDLPHTVTIDSLGIEVYVPARRWSILEIDQAELPRLPVPIYCSIGDHRVQGMERLLEFSAG